MTCVNLVILVNIVSEPSEASNRRNRQLHQRTETKKQNWLVPAKKRAPAGANDDPKFVMVFTL